MTLTKKDQFMHVDILLLKNNVFDTQLRMTRNIISTMYLERHQEIDASKRSLEASK